MESALSISNITKKYSKFTLGEVTVEVPKGFATALIGSNGAGKTTLLDIIGGIIRSDSGSVSYLGQEKDISSDEVRNAIGYCSSNNYFPDGWNVRNVACSMSIAYDNFDRREFAKLCEDFKLDSEHDKKPQALYKLSDGNKMRMYLAAVLSRNTKLLLLDEPASSLDPLMRDNLCDKFREYLNSGNGERSILFSTHNIADMEFATDYAIYMAKGKVIESGFVEELKEKYCVIHGDRAIAEKAKPFMLTCQMNNTVFEGIALSIHRDSLEKLDTAVETPSLQQLSVGILRKAEEDA